MGYYLSSPPILRAPQPQKVGRPPLFYTAQALRSRGGITENVPTLFLPFLHGNGMRAMHLYEDTSPPYPEVFRASAYVMQKMERKRMIRGGGKAEGERAGGACA